MFDYDIQSKRHFTGKDGRQTYEDWCKRMSIDTGDFPFNIQNWGEDRRGRKLSLNVASWGYYQGSDWRYYVFISYRVSVGSYTCAYHWDVDADGMPVGQPRKHHWNQ